MRHFETCTGEVKSKNVSRMTSQVKVQGCFCLKDAVTAPSSAGHTGLGDKKQLSSSRLIYFDKMQFYFQLGLTSVYCYCGCIFVPAGPGHWLNVGQLGHWEKAERLHREWLLPQPDLILMGTGRTET